MQIKFAMTITSSVSRKLTEGDVDIERLVDWPPDMRIPVKDDVISLDEEGTVFNASVEEVWLHPLGLGPFATVCLEDFINHDPDESAGIDFPDWTKT